LGEHVLTAQIFSVDHGKFQGALRKWFPKPLDDSACANLICRLDEYNIGTVNVTVLDEFAGPKSLEIKVAEYMFKGRTTSSSAISRNTEGTPSNTSTVAISTPPPQTPLLVWVDDNPSNNVSLVSYARDKLGITVLEIPGTAEAKVWIDENLGPQPTKLTN
jgi:hypothetical protein